MPNMIRDTARTLCKKTIETVVQKVANTSPRELKNKVFSK